MSTHVQALQSEQSEFKQGLGLFDATTLVAGTMIGSGVFVVISGMLQNPDPAKGVWGVPYPGLMLLVWVFCGIVTLMGAVSYAELAASMPKAGGPYVYLREAFGSFWAFLYGWTLFFAIQTGVIAGVAVAFGRFAYALTSHQAVGAVTGETWTVRGIALGCILFLTVWNMFGVRMGAFIQNLFTILKIGAILFLISVAFTRPAVSSGVPSWPYAFSKELAFGFGAAMVGALWAYDCWFNLLFAGEEVKNPKRTLPLALMFGTSLVMLVYCLANWSYVHVMPVAQIQHLHDVKGVAGIEAGRVMLGAGGALLLTIAILCSAFGCVNGILLSGPRAYYALAKDGLFFRQIAQIHKVYQTPVIALIVQAIWSSILVILPGQTYDKLLTYVEFTAFLFYAITIVGLFVLRAKYPDLPRPFKVPSIIPIVYFVIVVAFLLNTIWTQPRDSAYGLIIIGIGAIVYALIHAKSGNNSLEVTTK